jgi:hypothetical protein
VSVSRWRTGTEGMSSHDLEVAKHFECIQRLCVVGMSTYVLPVHVLVLVFIMGALLERCEPEPLTQGIVPIRSEKLGHAH